MGRLRPHARASSWSCHRAVAPIRAHRRRTGSAPIERAEGDRGPTARIPAADDELVVERGRRRIRQASSASAVEVAADPGHHHAGASTSPTATQEPTDWTDGQAVRTFPMTVVGVVRQPMDGGRRPSRRTAMAVTGPRLGCGEHFDERDAVLPERGGPPAPRRRRRPRVPRAASARLYGRDDLTIKDLADDIKRVENSTGLERTGLLLFAAAALVASVVLVGQAFLRSAHAGADSVPDAAGHGPGTTGPRPGLAMPHVVTVADRRRSSPPSPCVGLSDGSRSASPADSIPTSVCGCALRTCSGGAARDRPSLAALAVSRPRRSVATRSGLRSTRWWAGPHGRRRLRLGAPVPAGGRGQPGAGPAGASRLGPGPAQRSWPASARCWAWWAAFTLVGGIDDALAHPARSGRQLGRRCRRRRRSRRGSGCGDDGRVRDLALARRVASQVDGRDAPVYAVEPLKGAMDVRRPRGPGARRVPDEVLLGARTAKVLGRSIGDDVTRR